MSDFFEKVTSGQDIFKNLASKIPGFGGYVERQNRRAADKLLRETAARRFEELYARASALQADLASNGMISVVDDMEKAAIKIRTFIDKVGMAAYGTSGLFDAVKINEKELEQLYQFDSGFFAIGDQIASALDNVEASLGDEDALPAAIRNVTSLAREAVKLFERRAEVFTGSQ
ncbi:MAG: hypothetical protein HFACDABA_00400 [Anaerolineales bacterium]|nr:hypothetical protein [Anaerolineales bacterium]